jgi:hypothetical protein
MHDAYFLMVLSATGEFRSILITNGTLSALQNFTERQQGNGTQEKTIRLAAQKAVQLLLSP